MSAANTQTPQAVNLETEGSRMTNLAVNGFDVEALINEWLRQEQEGIQFPVDFEIAWQLAGYADKGKGKRRLTSNSSFLLEKEDYVIEKGEVTRTGKSELSGRSSDLILLTCDAFKQFCLIAETEQGRQIRQYFIETEKKYKAVMSKPISQLELAQLMLDNLKAQEQRLSAIEIENQQLKQQLSEQKHLLEAIDMETTANSAELERFKNGHGFWYTIAGWCAKQNIKQSREWMLAQGRKASAMCRQKGITPQRLSDSRYGTVNSYPDSILQELVWQEGV